VPSFEIETWLNVGASHEWSMFLVYLQDSFSYDVTRRKDRWLRAQTEREYRTIADERQIPVE
jgi:hypothetical protein